MRQLTRRQKGILDCWFDSAKDNIGIGFVAEQLPDDIWNRLVQINDTEILAQEIERYIRDKAMEEGFQRNMRSERK